MEKITKSSTKKSAGTSKPTAKQMVKLGVKIANIHCQMVNRVAKSKKHNLPTISFGTKVRADYFRHQRRLAETEKLADGSFKIIYFASKLANASASQLKETAIHEIVHCLSWSKEHHGYRFKRIYTEVIDFLKFEGYDHRYYNQHKKPKKSYRFEEPPITSQSLVKKIRYYERIQKQVDSEVKRQALGIVIAKLDKQLLELITGKGKK